MTELSIILIKKAGNFILTHITMYNVQRGSPQILMSRFRPRFHQVCLPKRGWSARDREEGFYTSLNKYLHNF